MNIFEQVKTFCCDKVFIEFPMDLLDFMIKKKHFRVYDTHKRAQLQFTLSCACLWAS